MDVVVIAAARRVVVDNRTDALVGRDGALATVDRTLAAARREPRVLAVLGEAGIGKSALLRALGERAEAAGPTPSSSPSWRE